MAGLRVLGTVGSSAGKKLLEDNGISEVYDHKSEGYADEIMVHDCILFNSFTWNYVTMQSVDINDSQKLIVYSNV